MQTHCLYLMQSIEWSGRSDHIFLKRRFMTSYLGRYYKIAALLVGEYIWPERGHILMEIWIRNLWWSDLTHILNGWGRVFLGRWRRATLLAQVVTSSVYNTYAGCVWPFKNSLSSKEVKSSLAYVKDLSVRMTVWQC